MKKILKGLFLVFYMTVLSAGVWVSRTSAVLISEPPPQTEAWKSAAQDLLPPHDNLPGKDSFFLNGREIFPAYQIQAQEDEQGQLLEFFNPEGFSFRVEKEGPYGPASLVIAIDEEGRVTGVRPIFISEPRGVGRAFEKAVFFWDGFKGRTRDELFLVSQGGKIAPVLGAVEASARYAQTVRTEVDEYHKHKNLWIEEAMRGRRSFQDLKTLQEQAVESAPQNEESSDENFFPRIF